MPERNRQQIQLRTLLHSRRNAWLLALLLGSITLLAAVTLLALSGWFISAAALAGLASISAVGFDYFRPAAIIRLCAIGRTAGRYAERLTSHYAALGLLKDLRVNRFTALAYSRANQRHSGDTLQRLVTDIDLLDQFPLKVIAPWFWACSLSAFVLLFWYWLAPALFISASVPLLLALAVPLITLRSGIILAKQDTAAAAKRRTMLLEPLSMLTALLLWQRWCDKTQQFSTEDSAYLTLQIRQQQLASRSGLIQQWLLAISLLALLWQGTALVNDTMLSVPLLLAAVLALWALHEVLMPLCHSFIALGLSMSARDRLNQIPGTALADNSEKPVPTGPFQLNVSQLFARQSNALYGPDNISFSLQSGDVLLISGPSGAGKTTLLQALANQLAYSGTLELNNQPFHHWQLEQTLGYLPQQLDIFDLTLAQNLRLAAPDASDEILWQVLADVALADWAKHQPDGLNTVLGEYGAAISGGQARRVALARLLLTERPVLMLDEPFAGLDNAITQHVLSALLQRQRYGLLIIVSHLKLDVPQAKFLTLK
ncbi:amino acid ABC transporter ATP-binding/permease protein [Rheinheimera baltica]|uniref:amino acid ABC transporter ATP-binding/permease protein n=1 Tax=Rheinheimera baltica TaxID=67576 RepID=UPI00273D5CC1|nr:ATP-binding cassette domain-containing protein [Rheinheimera baltica]MDP5150025.1 ATP-binding cassette domain-containing protein [Rheinheimera baltica]